MQSVLHPLAKTSIQARQSIRRLDSFKKQFPNDEYVKTGKVDEIINDLTEIRKHIPKSLQDIDLAR
jgi:hypothetical protein